MSSLTLKQLYKLQLLTARYIDRAPEKKTLLNLLFRRSRSTDAIAVTAYNHLLTFLANDAAQLTPDPIPQDPSTPAKALPPLPPYLIPSSIRESSETSLYEHVRKMYRERMKALQIPLVEDASIIKPSILSVEEKELEFQRAQEFAAAKQVQYELSRLSDISDIVGSIDSYARKLPDIDKYIPIGEIGEASTIRPGTLLLDHPSVLNPGRGAVLIYDISKNVHEIHGNEDWVLRGYSINRPLPMTVHELLGTSGLGHFGELRVFLGGNTGDELSILHRFPDIPGAVAIDGYEEEGAEGGSADGDDTGGQDIANASCGLYIGGSVEAVNQYIEQGRAAPEDFRVFTGRVEIPLRVTENDDLEIPDSETYIVASGPGLADVSLLPPMEMNVTDSDESDDDNRDVITVQHNRGQGMLGYDHQKFWHQNSVWSFVMRCVGKFLSDPSQDTDSIHKGKCIVAASRPSGHTAVAHFVAGGLTGSEVYDLIRRRKEESQGITESQSA